MALSLAVLAGIALLLPGLFTILLWNLRGRRQGGSRPDLPITAVSVLTISVAVSIFVHAYTWLITECLIKALIALGGSLPSTLVFGSTFRNPIETMVALASGGDRAAAVLPEQLLGIAVVLFVETLTVIAFVTDEGLDLALEGVDFGNQGWVYTSVIRPSQNGFRPIAYVLTTLIYDGLGVGYRGTVADIRQSDRGETLAVTLGEPARFLFELKTAKAKRWRSDAADPQFMRYPEEPVGSAVALDARVIQNIVISNRRASQLALLQKLEDDREASHA